MSGDTPAITGIVLAAGLGSRMGRPKADIVLDGIRLLDRATTALRAAGCEPVIAVVQQGVESDATIAINGEPERGMRSSLEIGLATVPADSHAAAVILVDMPGLTSDAIAQVIARWKPGRITMGISNRRRTHPTVMSMTMWREAIATAEADEGARRYLLQHPDLIDEVSVSIDATDLDTPDDLAQWEQR